VAFNRVRISAYDIGPSALEAHLRSILSFKPSYFLGYPSALYDFCVLLRDRGIDLRSLKLKAVFLTAEPLRPFQRTLIEEVTGARSVNTYGSAEGGFCAFECPAGALHIAAEAVWLSLRGNGADAPLAGEAILTDLMLRTFPIIRYALGDEVVLRAGKCSCGRAHPMLESIEGRSGEPITLPNGRCINSNLPSYIFKPLAPLGVVRRYRFVGSTDGLELFMVVSSTFQQSHLKIVEQECIKALGPGLNLRIRLVDSLPTLPNAKHCDFVRVNATG
jgi:phenylacetate-CoA ligase